MTVGIQTFGEVDPGTVDPELAARIDERRAAFTLLGDAVRVAYPEILTPAPLAENQSPADTVTQFAQFSANAALAQQVDSLGF